MKKIIVINIFVLLFMISCSQFLSTIHTLAQAATLACQAFAQNQSKDFLGMSPEAWCAIDENVAPFLDHLLQAENDIRNKAKRLADCDEPVGQFIDVGK
jgi:hypothetical protein